jgi:hypothetical protein
MIIVLIYFQTKGTLPTEIGSLTNLEELNLYDTDFTGITIDVNNKVMMNLINNIQIIFIFLIYIYDAQIDQIKNNNYTHITFFNILIIYFDALIMIKLKNYYFY